MTYRRPPDRFTLQAKKEGFAARSIYKLEEIDRRLKLFRHGQRVLDLGASPGSWTQYVAPRVGKSGKVVALDLQPLRVGRGPNVVEVIGDVMTCDTGVMREHGPYQVVLSDMAPHTSGIRDADVARCAELVSRAVDLSTDLLVPGGALVAKIFQGQEFEEIRDRLRKLFETVRVIKPEASRKESIEIYLVGLGRKP